MRTPSVPSTRFGRVASLVVISFMVAALALVAWPTPAPTVAAPCWRPPVTGWVTDPYRPPDCPYCAGNRGLEYRLAGSAVVHASAGGVVTFAGPVAGVQYVVVRLGSGWRLTFGRMSSVDVDVGDRVVDGARLGSARGSFFFGLRVGDEYRDPAPFLGRLVRPARLVPTDGSAARPAPPPVLRCGPSGSGALAPRISVGPVELAV